MKKETARSFDTLKHQFGVLGTECNTKEQLISAAAYL